MKGPQCVRTEKWGCDYQSLRNYYPWPVPMRGHKVRTRWRWVAVGAVWAASSSSPSMGTVFWCSELHTTFPVCVVSVKLMPTWLSRWTCEWGVTLKRGIGSLESQPRPWFSPAMFENLRLHFWLSQLWWGIILLDSAGLLWHSAPQPQMPSPKCYEELSLTTLTESYGKPQQSFRQNSNALDDLVLLYFYLKETRERGRAFILWFTLQCPQQPKLGQAEARSLELHLGLPHD